jgi:DNA-binding transcriptional LysR family regulator
VAPKRHRLGRAKRVALRDLSGEMFLQLDENTRTGQLIREFFRRAGFEPRVALDSGSFEVIKRYVAEGIGVAFLPRDVITRADRGLATITVPGTPRVAIGAIRRKGAYCTRAERVFLDLFR